MNTAQKQIAHVRADISRWAKVANGAGVTAQ
jgi:hypothetical protein